MTGEYYGDPPEMLPEAHPQEPPTLRERLQAAGWKVHHYARGVWRCRIPFEGGVRLPWCRSEATAWDVAERFFSACMDVE